MHLTSSVTHESNNPPALHLKIRSSNICLTIHREVYSVLSVPCRERCVFTDVGGLVGEAEGREGDGGVFKSWSPPPHCCVLEGDTVPVGWGHRHTQGRIGDRHILLSAIHQFLPCYLDEEGWMTCYDMLQTYFVCICPACEIQCLIFFPVTRLMLFIVASVYRDWLIRLKYQGPLYIRLRQNMFTCMEPNLFFLE